MSKPPSKPRKTASNRESSLRKVSFVCGTSHKSPTCHVYLGEPKGHSELMRRVLNCIPPHKGAFSRDVPVKMRGKSMKRKGENP